MKKIYLMCLVAGMAINLQAEQRLAKELVMAKDTIDLTETQYGIDELESFFYTSGGVDYCSYAIFNYDNDWPELRIEVKAPSRDKIQGLQQVVVETFSWLQMDENRDSRVYFTKVVFWLKFTHKNIDGDSQYDILAVANGEDGKVYKFRTNMPVYAYEKDEINHTYTVIKLLDEVDDSIVEPELDGDDTPTPVETLERNAEGARKVIENGQLYIIKNGEKYNLLGTRI